MQPSPAEVARTLATGALLGALHLRGHPDRLRVRHATGPDGAPLLLARSVGLVAAALRPAPGEADTAVVLSVDDVPPVAGAPGHGRLWLSGWATRLAGAEARRAAQTYAEINPTGDLLDVGHGHALYRLDVAEIRLARAATLVDVDVDDYLAAEPDPLHPYERELLAGERGRRLVERVAVRTAADATAGCRPLRLDRYGLVVVADDKVAGSGPSAGSGTGDAARAPRRRLAFPRRVDDLDDLTRLLAPAPSGWAPTRR